MRKPTALDFFAGSGLVTLGLRPHFDVLWANDICPRKAAVYTSNFGAAHFHSESIENLKGEELPAAQLSWASFPCQDLSLAGNLAGLSAGVRSGLFWQWVRLLDEMPVKPPVLCLENVVGFLAADSGRHFGEAYAALRQRGYIGGAFVLDAVHFVPQSRPRSFLVAVREKMTLGELRSAQPDGAYVTSSVLTAHAAAHDSSWIWWKLPPLPRRKSTFADVVEFDAPVHSVVETQRLLAMLSSIHRKKLAVALQSGDTVAGTGYKRMRGDERGKQQRLELRFDGIAGCLRTPNGGSSRQTVIIVRAGAVHTRLMTVREAARLMGAADSFAVPGSYNDGYRAMGDGVAVPVTNWIARHLLAPLCRLDSPKALFPRRRLLRGRLKT